MIFHCTLNYLGFIWSLTIWAYYSIIQNAVVPNIASGASSRAFVALSFGTIFVLLQQWAYIRVALGDPGTVPVIPLAPAAGMVKYVDRQLFMLINIGCQIWER